ncbi:hypothetical protein LJC56_01495 [Christensenellaceae bacterium OttesenSCG-928-K19]|nr:hypothetical protein [Christensenellaceae bacterium OttesenSCG-928-K19]
MENKKTFGIISLLCGILAIVLTFTPLSIVGLILAILGIVFSAVSKKKEGKNGLATGGLVLSIIALVIWIIVIVIVGAIFGAAAGMLGSLAGLM